VCYERDSLEIRMRRRFGNGDAYFTALSADWSEGVRKVFRELPELEWADEAGSRSLRRDGASTRTPPPAGAGTSNAPEQVISNRPTRS